MLHSSSSPLSLLLSIFIVLFITIVASSSFPTHHHNNFISAEEYCTFPSQRVQCGSLTCNTTTGQCIPCTSSSQCFNPALTCQLTQEGDSDDSGRCEMMDFTLLAQERPAGAVFSVIVGILTCAVAVIAGTGGGAILTALYQILLGIPLNESVALSQATIAGQSTFNMFLQMRRYHPQYQPPKPTRPVVNYALIAFWLPISLAGTAWGNLVGKVVPDWFRIVMLFTLLGYALKRLIDRMVAQKKEDEAKKAEAGRGTAVTAQHHQGIDTNGNPKMIFMNPSASNNNMSSNADDDEDGDDEEERGLMSGTNNNKNNSPMKHRQQYLRDEKFLYDDNDDDDDREFFRRERESRASTKPKAPKHILEALKHKTGNGDAQDVDAALIMLPSASNFSASNNNSVELQPTPSVQTPITEEENEKDKEKNRTSSNSDGGDEADHHTRTNNTSPIVEEKNQDDDDDKKKEDPKEAFPQFPALQLGLVFMTFVPLLLVNLIKNRWASCGGAAYWLLTIGVTIFNLSLSFFYRKYLANLNAKISIGEADPELVPFRWNQKTTVYFPILSATAGAAASLLGIGGGMILNFLFLEAGLIPEESSATGGFATFAVSFEALLQFTIQGKVRIDYFGIFFLAGLCATALGQLVLMPIIKKNGWRFLIVGSLAAIMGGSMLCVSIVGIYDTVELLQAGGSIGFGTLCHHAPVVHRTV